MKTLTKIKNWFLVKRYPFLKPVNVWTGLHMDNYDYSWTELDALPDGWRKAFGIKLCEEIRNALLAAQRRDPKGGYQMDCYSDNTIQYLYGYHINEIKEKFGELRWYDNGGPKEVYDIIDKYSVKSRFICIECGKPAEWISQGWICPWCDDCKEKIKDEYISIYEYYDIRDEKNKEKKKACLKS